VIRRNNSQEQREHIAGSLRIEPFLSEALAFAADAATYVLIGFSIAFFLIVTHSDLAVASQEMKPLGHAAIR
jgi:hypothetical protein